MSNQTKVLTSVAKESTNKNEYIYEHYLGKIKFQKYIFKNYLVDK